MSLGTFEQHALHALRNTDCTKSLPPSAVGHQLWERSDPDVRKRYPSAQGLALFASKFLRGLQRAGLARQRDGWFITPEGRAMLADIEREQPVPTTPT